MMSDIEFFIVLFPHTRYFGYITDEELTDVEPPVEEGENEQEGSLFFDALVGITFIIINHVQQVVKHF
jgi:hypothetical protein